MAAGLPWWLLPSAAALILVATHTYLGLHVISRNVFFVDLALAQVAALGSTVAFLYGYELSDPITYYVSLLFAVGGAWFFSVARLPENRVPQEAIIGLTFAVASAGAILLSAENPHGAEHLRDIMAGSILVVSAREVSQAAIFYGAIGVFHWLFRRPLLQVSFDREAAERSGLRVRWWDFLFYLSFAVVITSSVRIAGVLLVFILLIAPAVCGALFASSVRARLLVGWGCGILATIGGLMLSYGMDWPPAPAISCIFAAILIGSGVVFSVRRSARPALALARFAAAGLALCAIGFGLTGLLRAGRARHGLAENEAHPAEPHGAEHRHGDPEHGLGGSRRDLLSALADEHDNVRASAAEQLGKSGDPAVLPALTKALQDPADAVKEKAAEALGALARPESVPALEAALAQPGQDEWVQLREAVALVRCGGPRGMSTLIGLAREADAQLVRSQALQQALAFAGQAAPAGGAAQPALQQLETWWAANEEQARWDAATGRFSSAPSR
ncbi:MAG TPA: iron chelate uptake ABC transporter family permease subunit [Polyangiaceae bacterium]|nr:iron chelate uptake ABC transporter family permease subunit [Polyangiaceae bacterium]